MKLHFVALIAALLLSTTFGCQKDKSISTLQDPHTQSISNTQLTKDLLAINGRYASRNSVTTLGQPTQAAHEGRIAVTVGVDLTAATASAAGYWPFYTTPWTGIVAGFLTGVAAASASALAYKGMSRVQPAPSSGGLPLTR